MADNLTTATIDVRANTRGLEKDILKALRTVEFSEINTKKSSQALGRITGQVSEFNKSLEASNARVIAFGASAGAIFAVEKAFASLINSTIEVEKRLADINVLLNVSASGLQKFGDSLFGIARNTAQSFSAVADAAEELARQGLGVEETLKRTNAALILTRLSGLDAKSSVEALTATLNSFAGSALDAVEVVNKLANVDAAFAVSSADLANAISRVGSTAVDAGVSLDELIALVTSAQQTTARGGAVIGNSFKTIFTRLQRGKVQDLLQTLGVDTAEGQSAISMLQQLAATYDTLGAAQKSYVAEQVGGVFQINILKAALSDLGKEFSIYGRALDTSLSSTDEAIRRNELLNKTVSALSSQAYANLEQAASKIGSLVFEPNAKGFLSGFNDLLSSFNNIDMESAGGKLMTGFFKGIGDFIGGPGAVLATAVLVKLFSRLTQFAAGSAKELLGTNKAAQQQAAIEQSILSILQKNSQFTSQILSGKMTTVQAEKELLNYLTAQSNILREQERLSKVIGSNLRAAGVSIGASGVPMVGAANGKKAASAGYVPNFAADQAIGQALENAGAKEHGYRAGKAKKTTIHDGNGKSFKSFVNSKEDVKTFTNAAGKKATIVRPPNGFGKNTEYAAGGFIPSFAKNAESIRRGVDFEKRLNKALKGSSSFSPNAPMDFPLPTGYGSDYEARRAIGISDASIYGDAKLTRSRKSEQSLLDKYLRTSEGSKDFRSARETDKGFLNLKPKGLSMLFSGAGSDSRGISYISTVNTQLSSGAKKLIESRFGKKDKKSRTLAMPYIADKIDEQALSAFSSGFIPNFGKMQDFYKNLKEKEGAGDVFNKRAKQVNAATKKGAEVKDLGSLPYTMIHAGGGGNFQSSASYLKKDKKTNKETRYLAKIWTAGLDQSKLGGANVQKRVGDALVTEANNLSKIFNPSGGSQFSNYNQLSNTGSVFSAAGTVFESAIRSAFNVSAQGQSDRIDFPNPSGQLRSFFNNAPGSYEAKIENNDNNRSSALAKYIAINGLAKGYVPNFARSSGLSFSQTKKDEFGFKELRAAIGGKSVGAFSYAEDKRGEVEIGDFTVDKNHRGKGYGTALYQEAIKRNKGKKMKGQLLPQMNRLLEKIKKGEPVSAETLYPQIKRADLAKSSVFEVYGHKGMSVEEMTRDQFSSFVNAKINELKKDPKRLQSYFGNVEADEYGGLGIGLTTQHSYGFVPNFLDVTKGKLPIGVRGRTNYGSGGSKTNIQLGAGAEESTLAHELFHSAYSRSTFRKAEANPGIGKFLSSPGKYTGSGMLVGDKIFKNLNKNNLIKSLGLNPIQLDFDGKNPSATYSGSRAVDEITTRIQEKVFRNKGDLSKLSADEGAFIKNLEEQGIISNKRLSNVSRRSQEGSKFRSLVENKFSSIASSGFVPNFASQSLINEINKRILNPNIAQKLKEGQGLKDEAYIKAASRLGVNTSGLENFIASMGFPLKGKESINKVSSALGFGFGRSFAIDALKMGDWDYVKSSFEKNGLNKSDFDKLSQFAKTPKGESAFKWGFKSKAGGFVPNFANITSSTKDVRKKAHANQSSLNTFRVVHPLNPKIDAQGRVSFPDLEKIKGSAKIIHNEGMEGQNVFTLPSFLDFVNSRGNKQNFFRRNSFDYVLSSAGYVPNFADALNSAISREQAAGLSKSQIYVDAHSSLKNKNNPMGLMVANTRDEPKGGIQGIKRARKQGLNPKTYGGGMSSGYVPNFAFLKPDQEDVDALKEFTDALKKLEDDFSNPEKKAERLEKRKSRLESIPYGGVSTAETQAAESKITKAKDLRERLIQKGDMGGAQRAQALVQSAQSELSKLEKDLEKKIKDRIKSIDAQIAASKPSVEAYKAEQASLREQISSKKKETSFGGRLKKTIRNNSMGIGFGLQAAASMAGEYAGNDDTKTGRGIKAAAGGIGDIASFTGTGAMIAGPWGAAAGFAVGLGKAALDLTKALTTKVPDLEKALQVSSDSMNRFGESGQKILQLNEQYADALTSGGDPAKAADIMMKTQQAYAEELSKLTETQRSAMISAIAQGKGQEGYAKVLEELQQKAKADEASLAFQKYAESGGPLGGPDKKLIEGIDKTLVQDLTRGMDVSKIQSALDAASSSLNDFTAGTENQAIALMRSLAANASPDQQANLEQVIKSFESAAANTDLSGVAEAFIKGILGKPKSAEDAKKFADASRKNAENVAKKQKEEIAIREAANARLLSLQSETEAVYRAFNDGVQNLIKTMQTSARMREAAGEFKTNYYEQGGLNANIVDKQKEKNILRSSNDQLQIGKYQTQFDTMQNFQSAVEGMLSGITADAAKRNVEEKASDQENQLLGIKNTLEQSLLPIRGLISAGKYDEASAQVDSVMSGITPDAKAAIGQDAIVKGVQDLKRSIEDGNATQKNLLSDSRRDLAIQAQQLVFQKALNKLTQAQNFGGGDIRGIVGDDPENSFNKGIEALNNLKTLGYNQKDLQQGKTSAVKGGDAETWGVNGKKPNAAMSEQVIDFYKAAQSVSGESVISTQSKDFGALTQAVSDSIRKKMDELKTAGKGVVDPMVFARMEQTLATLGGDDKVSQLKILKELGAADIGGKRILDESLKGYSGGAFANLSPELKKAFEATTDEGAGTNLLLLDGQQKQTDTLSQGLAAVAATGLAGNGLLAMQPDAIAAAIGAVLEKGKAQENFEKEKAAGKELDKQYADTASQIAAGATDLAKKKQELESAKANLENSGISESTYGDQKKVDEAKKLTGMSLEDYLTKNVSNTYSSSSLSGAPMARDPSAVAAERESFTKKYNEAKAIVQASEDSKTIKQKESEIKETELKNKSLSQKAEEIRGKQDAQGVKSKDAYAKFETASQKAAEQKSLVFDASRGQNYIAQTDEAKAAREKSLADALAMESLKKTERQKQAADRTSGRETVLSPYSGQQNTYENVALTEYGGANTESFAKLMSQNVVPSLEKFRDVYKDMGVEGGAEAAYKKTKDELIGPEKTAAVSSQAQKQSAAPKVDQAQEKAKQQTLAPQAKQQQEQAQKQTTAQENSTQITNSILASVNQIAQYLSQQKEGGAQNPSSGQASAPGSINVSSPVSFTVNSENGQGGAGAATAIAEQIKVGLSSFLSSPEFIGKVTSIANQAAGNKQPPKVLPT